MKGPILRIFQAIIVFTSIFIISTSLKIRNPIMVIMALFLIFIVFYNDIKNYFMGKAFDKVSVIKANAKLISKCIEVREQYVTSFHYLTFELDNGNRKVFHVEGETYNSILENESGTISYKEYNKHLLFLNFKRD